MTSSYSDDDAEYAGIAGPLPIQKNKKGKVSVVQYISLSVDYIYINNAKCNE